MNRKFLGLRTTIYKVGDIDKAKSWYSKILGIQPYFDEPFYVGFNVGGYELGLQPEEGMVSQKTGGVTSYWGVENVQRVFDDLVSAGATANEKPQNVGGEIVVASVKDPWENLFGIIHNPEFKVKPS
ncbi:MAG: VOC family protein [Cyclobacteriaceae bacterium]